MPDVASKITDDVFESHAFTGNAFNHDELEPDEEDLVAALRNQDDIPILMDVVADTLSSSLSQEGQLSDAMKNLVLEQESTIPVLCNEEPDVVLASTHVEAKTENLAGDVAVFTHEHIAEAVSKVLEKRLPELVQEVLSVMQDLPTKAK
ncbi:hypothetical protein [Marinomonas flavescens]|uniref:hypothetical protein n=1 Tax=Marinomonas flavescens TaxID=2529379 RepID=UPI001054E067|nr:hypothetical protein [Marinomonas flavescens]